MSKSNYSHDRVASCVNRMWDTGLQYDSTEAVLAELQREVQIDQLLYLFRFRMTRKLKSRMIMMKFLMGRGELEQTPQCHLYPLQYKYKFLNHLQSQNLNQLLLNLLLFHRSPLVATQFRQFHHRPQLSLHLQKLILNLPYPYLVALKLLLHMMTLLKA